MAIATILELTDESEDAEKRIETALRATAEKVEEALRERKKQVDNNLGFMLERQDKLIQRHRYQRQIIIENREFLKRFFAS